MISAIEVVLKGDLSCRQAAEKYSVPREGLRKRILKCRQEEVTIDSICKKGLGYTTVFNEKQESVLCSYILHMEERMFGLTAEEIRKLAFQLAIKTKIKHPFNSEKGIAGPDWFEKFMKRHPQLSLRKPEPTSAARATGFNEKDVSIFYDLLEDILEKKKLTAKEIFNVDEFATSVVPKCVPKIVALKGKHQVASRKSAKRGQLVTAEVCFSAAGQYMPPMLIFPRKRDKEKYLEGKPEGAWAEFNHNGWIDSEIFTKWFKEFIKFTKCSQESPVLLVLDGHTSHVKNMDVIDLAQENGVIILCLPPHCTHRLQPLDVSFMKPLSLNYSKEVQKWLRTHPNRVVTMFEIFGLFGKAFEAAATLSTAKNGFQKTGIWPFNRNLFSAADFAASQTPMTNDETNNSSSFSNATDEESRSFRQQIEEAQIELDRIVPATRETGDFRNTDSHEYDISSSLIQKEFDCQNDSIQSSNSDLNLVNILPDFEDSIELNLPVTNADSVNVEPVRVLSGIDPNVQQSLKNDKPKSKRHGYTTVISSPEYKETLAMSKSKKQPKKPKKKENSSQPVAVANNALNVQVPVQFVQCMLPMPFQPRTDFQANENSIWNTPLHMLTPQEVPVLSTLPTQRNHNTSTKPAILPVQVQAAPQMLPTKVQTAPQMFAPRIQQGQQMFSPTVQPAPRMFAPKVQPIIPSSSLTIRPLYSQNKTQCVKPVITSTITIRPVHNQNPVQSATSSLSSPLTIRRVLN
ncbi:uncharacterized protein LOC122499682 [Leptopilina heterotoma]|uniref:uncharacterized protein LOC122499682 n=1 Tax=Leptopilina heterotoma TaxID=63436 RepID=UPI001CA9CBB5|nr:uncharacterized protein LOC122499682 [Leptopilina heterotoma]